MRKYLWLLAVSGLAMAAVIVGPASSSSQAMTSFGTCYRTNAFPTTHGDVNAFTVAAQASGTTGMELEWTSLLPNQIIDASVQYTFTGKVWGNDGTPYVADNPSGSINGMSGSLSIVFKFLHSDLKPVTFTPTCLQELATDPGAAGASFEAEMEGWVSNFPGEQASPRRAILSIHSEYDPNPSHLAFGVSLELGTTCHELPQYPNETELGGDFSESIHPPIRGSVKVSPQHIDAGRASLPPHVTPSEDPGAPCDGSVGF